MWCWWTNRRSAARLARTLSPTSKSTTRYATCSPHTREAQAHGYDSSHFSFNVPGGRCERCEGNGVEIKEMQFLADVELICEECKGHALQARRCSK